MSTIRHLRLEPRDGFTCRDGRGWSPSGLAGALELPWPSTIRGALRTAFGRQLEAREKRVFGKQDWLRRTEAVRLGRLLLLRARRGARDWERLWPCPADAVHYDEADRLTRLEPRPPELRTLGRDEDPAREALWRPRLDDPRKPASLPRHWPDAAFVRWLCGKDVKRSELEAVPEPGRRSQSHVGIDPEKLTAKEAILFAEEVVEAFDREGRFALGLEVELPEAIALERATLGGDRRLVELAELDRALFEPPAELLAAFRAGPQGLRLVLVTPARFEAGWLPDGFDAKDGDYRGTLPGIEGELVLRAAFVDRPIAVSGWDLAEGRPKRTERMAPAGSVFFVARRDGGTFGEQDARALWLAAIGGRTEEGFGRVVPGIWTAERAA
ncbi:MAG: type III-B CRISPR module-associated Cmr3 family protein [Geminicoccaceae bacterium]